MGLILASASPRRRELLTLAGVGFEAIGTDAEELTEGEPAEVVVENALRKARAGRRLRPRADLVLGADTEVALDGNALGKADRPGIAERYLRALSGRTHQVFGGIALIDGEGRERTAVAITEVTFAAVEEGLLGAYLASGEWRDRAGAYAVQGLGSSLVERINGDLANVIGLPLRALLELEPLGSLQRL